MNFGLCIRGIRAEKGITLRAFMLGTGIDVGRISQIERSIAEVPPTVEEIAKIKAMIGDFTCDEYKPDPKAIQDEKDFFEILRNSKSKGELLAHGILACNTHDEE